MGNLFIIIISSMLVSNVVLSQFLGICPFLGVSKQVSTAVGMGAAVTFVITIASAITWPIYYFLLEPNGLDYLQTIVFILIIACGRLKIICKYNSFTLIGYNVAWNR